MFGTAEDVATCYFSGAGFKAEGVEGLDHPAVGVFDGKGVRGNVAFGLCAGLKTVAGVVFFVPEYEGEPGALLPQFVEACLYQLSADALPLVQRNDGEGGEDVHQGRFWMPVKVGTGEEDVPDGLVAAEGEKGYAWLGGGVGKEVGGELGFFVVSEALLLHVEDAAAVVWSGFADIDFVGFHFVFVVDGAAALRAYGPGPFVPWI